MTDTQADLTERARDEHAHTIAEDVVATSFSLHKDIEWVKRDLVARIAYWLRKGGREGDEARRAAAQWHGHRYSEFQDQLLHKDMNKVTRARIEGQMLAHNESAKHFGAIASPAPQEETQ